MVKEPQVIPVDNSSKPMGTKGVKYSPGTDGPFRCDNCVHWSEQHKRSICDHKEVIEDKEMQLVQIGKKVYAKVDPSGCCEYFRRVKSLLDVPFGQLGL